MKLSNPDCGVSEQVERVGQAELDAGIGGRGTKASHIAEQCVLLQIDLGAAFGADAV